MLFKVVKIEYFYIPNFAVVAYDYFTINNFKDVDKVTEIMIGEKT